MSEFVDQLAQLVVASSLSTQRDIRGCSDAEIRELENHFEIRLPKVYKDFLKRMGKGAGLFMQGTDIFYEWLFGNREAMEDVLTLDKNPFSISKQVFVFSSHQGYIFHFFDTSAAQDDPPVYGYGEGELKPRLVNESLSDFLKTAIDEQIEGWAQVRNKPSL